MYSVISEGFVCYTLCNYDTIKISWFFYWIFYDKIHARHANPNLSATASSHFKAFHKVLHSLLKCVRETKRVESLFQIREQDKKEEKPTALFDVKDIKGIMVL